MTLEDLTKISLFQGKEIRRIFYNNEWWFSVIDVVALLTESPNPRNYWNWMKAKNNDSDSIQLSSISVQLKLISPDGKKRETDCANVEGILRIIQSIPSSKAEPFKRWLAKLGKERIDEIENPELSIERAKQTYLKKGYSETWIEKRVQSIEIRHNLTQEWDQRGAVTKDDYAVLSDEIMQAAFSLKTNEYKKFKGLKKENLRDHMTDIELVITMLGVVSTTQIARERDSQGIPALQEDAKEGGTVAGNARRDLEQRTGKRIISKDNALEDSAKKAIRAKKSRKKLQKNLESIG
jgi:DNA-damage-inducible protein D